MNIFNCGNCDHKHIEENPSQKVMQCRRYPPQVIVLMIQNQLSQQVQQNVVSTWPAISEAGHCGDWEEGIDMDIECPEEQSAILTS